ncbi:hypothetical protein D918_03894 [Trichuris suis]|nr:hypothetical protein D918_03894 [Trichuris suis]
MNTPLSGQYRRNYSGNQRLGRPKRRERRRELHLIGREQTLLKESRFILAQADSATAYSRMHAHSSGC